MQGKSHHPQPQSQQPTKPTDSSKCASPELWPDHTEGISPNLARMPPSFLPETEDAERHIIDRAMMTLTESDFVEIRIDTCVDKVDTK